MSAQNIVAPSILAADFSRLAEEVAHVKDAAWLHIDVMDGHFVPNISLGPPVVASLRRVTDQFFDVHLMIENPDRYIDVFAKSGADQLTVHAEACPHLHRTISHIREQGLKAGVAINPHTPLAAVECILPDVDMVLVMTVNPGFGGQSFIAGTMKKVAALRQAVEESRLSVHIQVDGGIDASTIHQARAAGANVFVAGSAVFGKPDPYTAWQQLQAAVTNGVSQ